MPDLTSLEQSNLGGAFRWHICTSSMSGNVTKLSAIEVAPLFGPAGCLQASRKWIGTTECATLLRYWGVRAHIVDFKAGTLQAGYSCVRASGMLLSSLTSC